MAHSSADCALEASPGLAGARMPTSALLERLKRDLPGSRVTFGWLFEYLRAQSPEALILFLSVIGVLPGVSLFVGVLLAILSLAILTAREERVLPVFIAEQRISSSQLVKAIECTIPVFLWSERYVRPRDIAAVVQLRPVAAFAILFLSVSMLVPLPLSNIIPSLVIGLIAFASIEKDALLLSISIGAAIVSLIISSAVVWAALGLAARAMG